MQKNLEKQPPESPEQGQFKKINHNGFTNSPPASQLAPPILVLIIFGLTLAQVHGGGCSLTVAVLIDGLVAGLLLAACVLWYQATKIVPTDSIQLKHLEAIEKGEDFDSSVSASFCQVCQTHIGRVSYHCKKCQRCVEFFDHHCKWLNNCIGAKNYFEFYGLLLVTFALFSICIAVNAYVLALDEVSYYEADFIIAVIVVALASIPSLWLMYLIALHSYLIIAKRTTIELILESRKKSKTVWIGAIKCNPQVNRIIKLELPGHVGFKDQETPSHNASNRTDPEQNHNETNHVLIRAKLTDQQGVEAVPLTESKEPKALPPIKVKVLGNGEVIQLRKSHNMNPIFCPNA